MIANKNHSSTGRRKRRYYFGKVVGLFWEFFFEFDPLPLFLAAELRQPFRESFISPCRNRHEIPFNCAA
jgi:hypothetical protein